jgi:SNF2 family DNA or RNA helicase
VLLVRFSPLTATLLLENDFLPLQKKKEGESQMINTTLYDYQVAAVQFVSNIFDAESCPRGAALFMDMGTGKSLTTLAVIDKYREKINRVLIVCPCSVMNVWAKEIEKHTTFPSTELFFSRGSKKEKKKAIGDAGRFSEDNINNLSILITSYETLKRDEYVSLFHDYRANLCVLDESHKIKNRCSDISGVLHKFAGTTYKLILTGTPVSNNPYDIFSQYLFLDPTIFGTSYLNFFIKYPLNDRLFISKKNEQDFLSRMYSIGYSIKAKDVLDLPNLTHKEVKVFLEKEAAELYNEIFEEYKNMCFEYAETNDARFANKILAYIMKLSQITGGFLSEPDVDNEGNKTRTIRPVSYRKLDKLIDLVRHTEGKIVVICKYIAELDAVYNSLMQMGINCVKFSGRTKNRSEVENQFRTDEEIKVFIGQISVTALGIDLTVANTMIFFSMDFSYNNFEQAQARIWRNGQTKECEITYLLVPDTFDEVILSALRSKQNMATYITEYSRKNIKKWKEEYRLKALEETNRYFNSPNGESEKQLNEIVREKINRNHNFRELYYHTGQKLERYKSWRAQDCGLYGHLKNYFNKDKNKMYEAFVKSPYFKNSTGSHRTSLQNKDYHESIFDWILREEKQYSKTYHI